MAADKATMPKSNLYGNNTQRIWTLLWRDKFLYILIAPVLVYFIIFKYLPMWGLVIAFQKFSPFKGIFHSPWVGFANFESFFMGRDFFKLIRNTLLINIYSLIFGFPSPIIFALLLNEIKNSAYKRTVQTISYLPHFISTVVIVGMVVSFLSPTTGFINQMIAALGFQPVFFMGEPKYFRTIYVASGIWQNVGWSSIVYLAALSGIDPTLYEAAIIDGAGKFKQLLHVTLPSIASTIIIMLILRVAELLNLGFEKVYLMTNPMVNEVADVISTYVYRRGIINGDFGFATAVGLFNSVISLILVAGANWLSKKTTETAIW